MDQRLHRIEPRRVAVVLDLLIGNIRSFEIDAGDKILTPLHTAPWVHEEIDDPLSRNCHGTQRSRVARTAQRSSGLLRSARRSGSAKSDCSPGDVERLAFCSRGKDLIRSASRRRAGQAGSRIGFRRRTSGLSTVSGVSPASMANALEVADTVIRRIDSWLTPATWQESSRFGTPSKVPAGGGSP